MRHKYLILFYVPKFREVFHFESFQRNEFAKRIIFCLLLGEKVTFHNMCNGGCTTELNKNRIVFPIEKTSNGTIGIINYQSAIHMLFYFNDRTCYNLQ